MTVIATQPHNVELARYYMKSLRDIKEKKVLTWTREMKHSICNFCNMLLVPGVTASVVAVKSGGQLEQVNCLSCNNKKKKMLPCSRKREKGKKKK